MLLKWPIKALEYFNQNYIRLCLAFKTLIIIYIVQLAIYGYMK